MDTKKEQEQENPLENSLVFAFDETEPDFLVYRKDYPNLGQDKMVYVTIVSDSKSEMFSLEGETKEELAKGHKQLCIQIVEEVIRSAPDGLVHIPLQGTNDLTIILQLKRALALNLVRSLFAGMIEIHNEALEEMLLTLEVKNP